MVNLDFLEAKPHAAPTFTSDAPTPSGDFGWVLCQAFSVVAVAEIFDKTWFVTLLYTLQHGPKVAFAGASTALAAHVVLAVGLGACISRAVPLWVLHFVTGLTFGILAVVYMYEFFSADPDEDAVQARSEEARREVTPVYGSVEGGQACFGQNKSQIALTAQVFLAVFIAEWGDRTQVSMFTLGSSLPALPVCLGSLAAFIVLTASAVIVSQFFQGTKVSERLICGISAVSFFVFSALAFVDSARALRSNGMPVATTGF